MACQELPPFESKARYRLLPLASHIFFFHCPQATSGVVSELGHYRLLPGCVKLIRHDVHLSRIYGQRHQSTTKT